MTAAAIALAFASAFCFGVALVLTQLGLRHISPLAGAAISIPSSALLFIGAAPFVLADTPVLWLGVPIFAAVGLLFPAAVTLLTFEANRVLGPVITGALGNLAPLFAVALAFVLLGEPLRSLQVGGLVVTVAGIIILTAGRGEHPTRWRSWHLALPLAAAAIRGFIQPTIKLGLEFWPSPFAAALIGYIVSAIVLITVARLRTGRYVASAPLGSRLWFVAVGFCNGLAVLLMYAALASGRVALVSPLVATYPLVTVVFGTLVLGKIDDGTRLAVGTMVIVAGVALLITG